MIARFHYDRDTLTRFLDEEAGSETAEIASHVEECDDCQSALESLMQDGLTMDRAGELLRPHTEPDQNEAELVKSFDGPDDDPKVLATSATSFLEPSDDPDSIGRFARYEIKRILGRGGMGIVMQALDTSLGRHCAVKVLAPELASSAAARKRFSREAKSAAAVVHPHVVPIQTVDEYNGMPYLVMPVVEGQSLQQRVDSNGPLSVIETVRIASQVAEGLAAAHDQGLVHRDIKPANVLLENGVERVQITDFGLARAVDDASMTRSGVIAGTPQYMSPEQAHGDTIDHRSDLFSLGSLIYFMLAGRSPFRAETTMGVLNRIGNDEPRSIRSINADVPQWLEQIVMKLLAKSPDDRFQTASEVAELLQTWHAHLQQPDVVVRPTEPTAIAAGLPSEATRPEASVNGSRGRFTKGLIATTAFAFFLVLATVIILETNKGTIRIESNLQTDVPIRIAQGDKVVDEFTVTQSGAKTRLRAGNYSIEFNGEATDIQISGDRVTLKRGETWLAKIDVRSVSDPLDRIDERSNPELQTIPSKMTPGHAPSSANPMASAQFAQPVGGNPPIAHETYTLAGKVGEFNQKMLLADGDYPQPPLTIDELLSFSQWDLQSDGERSTEVKDLLTNLGIGRYLPEEWTIEGGESKATTNDGEIDIYTIELANRYSNSKLLVRKRHLVPPINFQGPRKPDAIDSATPLAAAITEFNAMHNSIDGKRQPPLTINEVLAAIVDWNSRRNEASIDNKTFADFQEIALTHQLPAGAKLEVLPSFGSLEGDTFKIWSVRIRMPQVTKPGHTFAFLIRKQHISVDSVDDGVVHWGKPNDKGLQAGVRLIPGQRSYQVGQPIKTEFVYRSISGKAIYVTLPNIFYHKKLIAHDADGIELDVVEVSEMTIGGAVETEIGEKPTIKSGRPLSLGYITPVWGFDIEKGHPAETNLTVTDGLKCFLTYVVSDLDGGELQTGELVFDVAGHKTATRPRSKSEKMSREATLDEAVNQFNAQSAEDRKTLFDPPIPDMTTQQLRKAFQDTAALYQQSGDQIVANALNQISESGKVPFGLPSILRASGVTTKDNSEAILTKQIAPSLIIMDGPSSGRYVFLRPVELIYNKFGQSSKSYGDLFDSKHWNADAAQRFDTSALQAELPQQPEPKQEPKPMFPMIDESSGAAEPNPAFTTPDPLMQIEDAPVDTTRSDELDTKKDSAEKVIER